MSSSSSSSDQSSDKEISTDVGRLTQRGVESFQIAADWNEFIPRYNWSRSVANSLSRLRQVQTKMFERAELLSSPEVAPKMSGPPSYPYRISSEAIFYAMLLNAGAEIESKSDLATDGRGELGRQILRLFESNHNSLENLVIEALQKENPPGLNRASSLMSHALRQAFDYAQALANTNSDGYLASRHLLAAFLDPAVSPTGSARFNMTAEGIPLRDILQVFREYLFTSPIVARVDKPDAWPEILNRIGARVGEGGNQPAESASSVSSNDEDEINIIDAALTDSLRKLLSEYGFGRPRQISDGSELESLDLIRKVLFKARDLLEEARPQSRFWNVVSVLLPYLERFVGRWETTFSQGHGMAPDARAGFRLGFDTLECRIFGFLKALEEINHKEKYESYLSLAQEDVLTELRREFQASVTSTPEKESTLATSSHPISIGIKMSARREAMGDELCLNIDEYAEAIADTFTSSAEEYDFVFALYGPWGRGKSTLIERAARCIRQGDKSSHVPRAPRDYLPVFFSAWKFPSRPEVWVYLYQRIAREALKEGFWQKLQISFRIGLLKNGWWPLFLGFGLVAVSRLQIDFGWWIFESLGLVGLLILASFVWNITRLGKTIGHTYFSLPDHAEKLGLQAVIGDDLKALLKVWIKPGGATGERVREETVVCDFDRSPARLRMVGIVLLIWCTVGIVAWKVGHHLPFAGVAAAPASEETGPRSGAPSQEMRIFVNAEWNETTLELSGSTGGTNAPILEKAALDSGNRHVSPQHYSVEAIVFWLAVAVGILAPAVFAWALARSPKQHERVLLVVDDLDRCEPEQMLAVIESLRLFLDDEEMSRRLQVAMLVDRKILSHAIFTRAKNSGLLGEDATPTIKESFFRAHEEKLFVVSLELPLLGEEQIRALAGLIVNREFEEQKKAQRKSTVRGPAINNPPQPEDGGTPSTPPVFLPPDGIQVEGTSDLLNPLEHDSAVRSTPPGKSEAENLSEVSFSEEERRLLVDATAQASSKATPRSIRAFVLRYQLVRLILQRLKRPYQPDRLIAYMAAHLLEGASDGQELDANVREAVHCVIGRAVRD